MIDWEEGKKANRRYIQEYIIQRIKSHYQKLYGNKWVEKYNQGQANWRSLHDTTKLNKVTVWKVQ